MQNFVFRSDQFNLVVTVAYEQQRITSVDLHVGSDRSDKPHNALEQLLLSDLSRYFAGEPVVFQYDVLLEPCTVFQRQVLDAIREIPYGKTLTYAAVARTIGRSKAYRAVGSACGHNPVPIIIPCHRVVAAGGLGGFGCGIEIKRILHAVEQIDAAVVS